eukprot:5399540-Pyramimonas_sp.AAC.1
MAATNGCAAHPLAACGDQQVPTGFAPTARHAGYRVRHVCLSTCTTSYAHHSFEDSQAATTRTSRASRYVHAARARCTCVPHGT